MDQHPSKLLVAESFYSQQSEGISTGYPAYFIRLAKCNLLCGGINGKLIKEGKATWFCDTIPVWKKGQEISFNDLIEDFYEKNIFQWILQGRVRVIFSGGEPAMEIHQLPIIEFIKLIQSKTTPDHCTPFFEIETNGTNVFKHELISKIQQINCSPKLANSGMSKNARINPEAIKQILLHTNCQFKFVITEEKDIIEFRDDFVTPFDIPWQNIVLMPGVDNRKDLPKMTKKVFELGKKYGYRAITRSHILAWDQTTGV